MSEYSLTKNELYHYGIKGQKWGQRRWQYDDGRFNEAGKERYFGKSGNARRINSGNEANDNKKELSNKERLQNGFYRVKKQAKKIINSKEFKIAAIVGAGILSAYLIKRASQEFKMDLADAIVSENSPLPVKINNNDLEIGKWNSRENGFQSLDDIPKASIDYYKEYFENDNLESLLEHNNFYELDDLKGIRENPIKIGIKWGSGEDPDGMLKYDMMANRFNNCSICTKNAVMRLKGYECMAQETANGDGWTKAVMSECFEGAKEVRPKKHTVKGFIGELEKQPVGSYGEVTAYWKSGGGHSMLYTVKKDGVHIICTQTGHEYPINKLFRKAFPENSTYTRLDNCSPKEGILKAIESEGHAFVPSQLIRYD